MKIVVANTMTTCTVVTTMPRSILRSVSPRGRLSRRPAGDGAAWVYVAYDGGVVRVSPGDVPRNVRVTRGAGPTSTRVPPGPATQVGHHWLVAPDIPAIVAAVAALRERWMAFDLPLDWRLMTSTPGADLMPCLWTKTPVPVPPELAG